MRLVLFLVLSIFSDKMFVVKHLADFILPTSICETNLIIDGEMINVSPFSGSMRRYILKALNYEAKDLQEIITTSSSRKIVCESIIKMLIPNFIGAPTSQSPISSDDNATIISNYVMKCSSLAMMMCLAPKMKKMPMLLMKKFLTATLLLHHSDLVCLDF